MAEAAKTQDAQQSNVKAGASASLDPKMRPVKNRLVEYFVTVGIGGVGDPIIPIQDPGKSQLHESFPLLFFFPFPPEAKVFLSPNFKQKTFLSEMNRSEKQSIPFTTKLYASPSILKATLNCVIFW